LNPSPSETPIPAGKVFGIGLSRTGTTKLARVLGQLGYRTRHFIPELFEPEDWSVVDTLDALADFPIQHLYKECDRRYPGSKFILTTRDVGSWLDSMKWMFKHGKVIWNWGPDTWKYLDRIYHTNRFNQLVLTERWYAYHADVFEYFDGRDEDLLVLDISDGFDIEGICDFLGVECREIDTDTRVNSRRKASLRRRVSYALRSTATRFLSTTRRQSGYGKA
jgi:hypothetical protein